MKSGDIYTAPDGNQYRACEFDSLQCETCKRVTLSGLCGCSNAQPVKVGSTLVGMPLAAEREFAESAP